MSTNARFLPWARRSNVTSSSLIVHAAGRDVPVSIGRYGPGDAIGITSDMIRRRDPVPGSIGLPPNLLASIEFTRPDFPWCLSPGTPTAAGNLQPWIALLVLDLRAASPLAQIANAKLPVIEVPRNDLPAPADLAFWAHVQIDADAAVSDDVTAHGVSRVLSARALAPNTRYLACLVPTFEAGRLAGLGQTVPDPRSEAPAWTPGDGNIQLPVYDSWSFTTADSGDLETLARKLRGRDLAATSHPLRLDVSAVSGNTDGNIAPLEGALRPLGTAAQWTGPAVNAASQKLNDSLNRTNVVGMPIYGSIAAAKDQVVPGWMQQLNLNPLRRAAAGLGAQMVKDHQEDLVDEAWRQAGDIHRARRERQGALLADFASQRLYARTIAPLREAPALLTLAPALTRMTDAGASNTSTIAARLGSSTLPPAAVSATFRRILNSKTTRPVRRTQAGLTATLVQQNAAVLSPGELPADPPKLVTDAKLRTQITRITPTLRGNFSGFVVTTIQKKIIDTSLPQVLARKVAVVDVVRPKSFTWVAPQPIAVNAGALARFNLRIDFGGNTGIAGDSSIRTSPFFTQPLAAWLDPAFLLAGIDLPPDTAGLLEVNGPFVESLMIGANHELARELLWRGVPLERTATLLTRFFETRVSSAPRDMNAIATWDAASPLGSHLATGEKTVFILHSRLVTHLNETVIFLTEAVADGTQFRKPGTSQTLPLFRGLVGLDTAYLGFDKSPDDLKKGLGFYIVIQELAGAVRFGLDETGPDTMASWNDLSWSAVGTTGGYISITAKSPKPTNPQGLTWGINSGQMAAILLQRPIRLSIHTSLLLPPEKTT